MAECGLKISSNTLNESSSQTDERRRHYRIRGNIGLSFRILEGPDVDVAVARFGDDEFDTLALAAIFSSTSIGMRHALEGLKRDVPEVATYLEGLNTKLDILSRLLIARDSGLPSHPTHAVSLSASGICFFAEQAVAPGSLLELKLLVFPSHVCVLTLGAVVGCEKVGAPEPRFPYQIRVDFSYIREDDQELIIRHVIQRQSENLRKTRSDP